PGDGLLPRPRGVCPRPVARPPARPGARTRAGGAVVPLRLHRDAGRVSVPPDREDAPAMSLRNRIKEHRRVRAGDLVPHELNYRLHPQAQRDALAALYDTVGFARSLLA